MDKNAIIEDIKSAVDWLKKYSYGHYTVNYYCSILGLAPFSYITELGMVERTVMRVTGVGLSAIDTNLMLYEAIDNSKLYTILEHIAKEMHAMAEVNKARGRSGTIYPYYTPTLVCLPKANNDSPNDAYFKRNELSRLLDFIIENKEFCGNPVSSTNGSITVYACTFPVEVDKEKTVYYGGDQMTHIQRTEDELNSLLADVKKVAIVTATRKHAYMEELKRKDSILGIILEECGVRIGVDGHEHI